MNVQIEKLETKSDPRGCVWEPLGAEKIAAQQNCHVVITGPGGIRGNHFHKRGVEIATQRGPALVRFCDARGVQDVNIAEGEVYRFVFPPNCAHAFHNSGTTPNVLVAFNTAPFDPAAPDVFRQELIS
jgi:dTDP-4-dehydrorhamnose 3,5-epimerase-like enzyme